MGTGQSAVPCLAHLRQSRRQLDPGEGAPPGAPPTASNARAPGPRSEGVSGSSSLSLEPPVSVTASPLTCIQVHSPTTRLGSAPLFLVQQPIAKGQQCALRERGGGGDAPPRPRRRARDAGPGRGGHCELKARGHIAENPDRAALRPFCQLGFSFGFPITLRCCKQQK